MSYKKLLKEYTPKELAEAFIFPVRLSPKKRKEADQQLAEALKKSRQAMTKDERLAGSLMGLKFRIFAAEIGIDETLLSQLINRHRMPPFYLPIRLELHSNNSILAEYWLRVMDKDREREMLANKAVMMKKEKKFVTGAISVKL